MQKLFENWQNFLKEEKQHYEISISLKIEADLQLYGQVFNQIRAIPGITIVKSEKKTQALPDGNKITNLNLKFLMFPGLGSEYLPFLKSKIKSIRDAQGDKILGIRVTKAPMIVKK